MIDFRFILLPIFAFILLVVVFSKKNGVSEGLLYFSGFGFFLIGLDIISNKISDISVFLNDSTGVIFLALGLIILIRTPLLKIEEDW